MFGPVDDGVHSSEPGESKDDILLTTAYDVEEMLLSNPFNVGIEDVSVMDCTSLVHCSVNIMNGNRGDEFFCGELIFSDELPVDAGNISTRVY